MWLGGWVDEMGGFVGGWMYGWVVGGRARQPSSQQASQLVSQPARIQTDKLIPQRELVESLSELERSCC